MKRLFGVLALAAITLVLTAPAASAHNVLISSDPAKGASLETSPSKITLTFDAPVQPGNVNQVAVTGPDGNSWTEGTVEVTSNVVTTPLRPLGPAGEYTIGYRILSADGHPVSAEVKFTLTKAGTGTPASAKPTAAPDSPASDSSGGGGGIPVWIWIIGAVVLLGAGFTLALRVGRTEK
jgi:hypothetical protein